MSHPGFSNRLISTYPVVLLGIPVDKQNESYHYYDYYYPYWNSSIDVREQTEISIKKLWKTTEELNCLQMVVVSPKLSSTSIFIFITLVIDLQGLRKLSFFVGHHLTELIGNYSDKVNLKYKKKVWLGRHICEYLYFLWIYRCQHHVVLCCTNTIFMEYHLALPPSG